MEIDILKNKPFFIAELYENLRSVIDPELGINIVDLGLVYNIEVWEHSKEINVTMTLSTKGCPAGEFIINCIWERLKQRHPDWQVEVQLVWEPEWTVDNISEEGKTQLGLN
ncbi:metal-sulfur cluster assembly factor [Solitalea lacus]|uniref:metal-sulfur cluster assembly factor n=1 Tax=Solitalea lacus TaxID=2911172 RepID=UPI001ED9D35A|nr:metal-sulfur cluster assembly factor [Solitalea lacus]UKJ08926.1 metal-sulfur cluster assembly factor [Solitalea lacus]